MIGGREVRLPLAIVRALIRWLPPHLQQGYGKSILDAFEAGWLERRHRGRIVAAWYTLRVAGDLLLTSTRERRRVRARPIGSPATSRPTSDLSELAGELPRALRSLRRAPGFTAAAVLLLGIGIGVNASIFTALRALLIDQPPYPEADRLVIVRLTPPPGAPSDDIELWSYPKLQLLREMPDALFEPAAFASRSFTFEDGADRIRATVEMVSQQYLEMLGARTVLGRTFNRAEDDAAAPSVVAVISHEFWTGTLGSDPQVVGRTLIARGKGVRIVGVAEPGFQGLTGGVDAWIPITAAKEIYSPQLIDMPSTSWFQVIGRLAPTATSTDAQTWADAAAVRIHDVYPGSGGEPASHIAVQTLREARSRPEARSAVFAMEGAALAVLLITCANLAGLLVARGASRRQELAVRLALGASRGRVARQLLAESLVIAMLGGLASAVVAHYGLRILREHWPTRFIADSSGWLQALDLESLALDPAILGVIGVLTLTTAVLFGVLPSLQLSRSSQAALGSGTRALGGGRAPLGLRGSLISTQVAFAFVLLIGAGLMTTTLNRLLAVERGFEAEDLLAIDYAIPRGGSDDVGLRVRQEALLARISADPRVVSASLSCIAPLSGWCLKARLRSDDVPASEESAPEAGIHIVGADFFATLGTEILAGRPFAASDDASAERVAILNRSAARALFGAGDPIGRTVRVPEVGPATIVGVAQDLLHGSRIEEGATPEVYVPFAQSQSPSPTATLLVRGSSDAAELAAAVERILKQHEPGTTVSGRTTGEELLGRATADRRALLWLLGVFAVSAVSLAALGIWSIVTYSIGQRTQELGVRAALGASGFELMGLVARGGVIAAACGILPGAVVAYFGSGVLSSLVYDVTPTDPGVYLITAVGFLTIALVASAIPALRAARLDPVRAMRVE